MNSDNHIKICLGPGNGYVYVLKDIIGRVASMPIDGISSLRSLHLVNLAEKVIDDENNLETKKEKLTNVLFELIDLEQKEELKRTLLNLKRDIYNDRELSKYIEGGTNLSSELENTIIKYVKEKALFNQSLINCQNQLAESLQKERNILCELIDQEELQKGLVLSSQSLLERIPSYKEKVKLRKIRKKEKQVEHGLIKYVSRLHTKSTPYSTFTNLVAGNLEENSDEIMASGSMKSSSKVRINNFLFYFLRTCLEYVPSFSIHLVLSNNKTLYNSDDDHWEFLVNSLNVESFQKMEKNEMTEFVCETLNKSDSIKFGELIKKLSDELEESYDSIQNYLWQLIQIGIIEFNWPASGMDPDWVDKLYKSFSEINDNDNDILDQLVIILSNSKKLISDYESTDNIKIRKELIKNFHTELKERADWLFDQVLETSRNEQHFEKYKPFKFNIPTNKIILEDSHAGNCHLTLPKKEICERIESMTRFVQGVQVFDRNIPEKKLHYCFFQEHFKNRTSVPLLEFYKEYYKLYQLPLRAKQTGEDIGSELKYELRTNEVFVNFEKQITKWREEARKYFKKKFLNRDSFDPITILETDLVKINEYSNNKTEPLSGAYTNHLQMSSDPQNGNTMICSLGPGNGKMVGRFLHLFEGELTERFRQFHTRDESSFIKAKICDTNFFNANIHPHILNWEIVSSNSQTSLSEKQQIKVAEILLIPDCKSGLLKLIHSKTKKEIKPIDAGLQSVGERSELYKLLNYYSDTKACNFYEVVSAIPGSIEKVELDDRGVTYYPEIKLGETMTLSRQMWKIDIKMLHRLDLEKENFRSFSKLLAFFDRYNIPKQFFVKLYNKLEVSNISTDKVKYREDDYKPTYVDLNSVIYFNYFIHLLKYTPKFLRIEPVFPKEEDMLVINNKRYNSEIIVQWEATA